jgi:REP element-mobilizing transposase RayT
MPAYARRNLVNDDQVGVYHCIARCVRRAFLCGVDPYNGRNYNHRKKWVLNRLRQLAGVFGIEVCGYAVLSNHIHLVLRNRPDVAQQWSIDEVALRWRKIFPIRDETTGEAIEPEQHDLAMLTADPSRVASLRARLASLSWFMRCLCEWIARKGNHEDECRGRFWEGRFRSQILLDESAILACSVYVDLNPIRAGIAATPEESEYTSGCDRIRSLSADAAGTPPAAVNPSPAVSERPDSWLCELTLEEAPMSLQAGGAPRGASQAVESESHDDALMNGAAGVIVASQECARSVSEDANALRSGPKSKLAPRASDQGFLPIEIKKYLMLLDWTGRELRQDERGAIPDHLGPILDRLGLDRSNWVQTVREFGRMFKQAAGRASSLGYAAPRCSRRWFQGKSAARLAFL